MIEDHVIKSWAIAAQSTQAMLFHVPTENMRRIFRYVEDLQAELRGVKEDRDTYRAALVGAGFLPDRAALKGEKP